ncbi:MAG: Tat pathway signal protein [Candidatus Hydrogenedentota bacterium]
MTPKTAKKDLYWANLVHISFEMWWDRELPADAERKYYEAKPYLRLDDSLWNDILERMRAAGMNMIILDLGNGIQYDSHPEITLEHAWPPERLREELAKCREMGLQPIPKLNFSACHDFWLHPYDRMVSTPTYYAVCSELIAEVIELFDTPAFFHLGMDEETAEHQRKLRYAVIRQYDLWWHDLNILIDAAQDGGSRPWVWSDYLWHHPEDFFANMPTSVLQSNWYYRDDFDPDDAMVKAYTALEEQGYDQVPTGSNYAGQTQNFQKTVEHCSDVVGPDRLFGFIQSTWRPTQEEFRDIHMNAIEQVEKAREWYENHRREA